MNAVAKYRREQEKASKEAGPAPPHRHLQPLTALRKLAAAPVLSPPLPEQVTESQFEPVRLSANVFGSDRYTPTADTPTADTPTADTPTAYTPTAYTPAPYAPTQYAPTQYAPTQDTPTQYAPIQYTPAHYAPTRFSQNQFDPNHIDGTLGHWNPGTNYSLQYLHLENLPDEQFHHPRESRVSQREFSQVPSGPLQCHEGFGPTDDALMVQPDWDTPYVDHQNLDGPSEPIWSEIGFPARSVPWSSPVSNDFGLGSMDNAQTLAESSHHVEQARSLGYMMPPWEDGWA